MIDELREELYLYNFLRQLFLKEPTKELINSIMKIDLSAEEMKGAAIEGLISDMTGYGLRLMADSANKNKHKFDEWLEDIALEYARLFIGPQNPPAVPYASFYLSESHSLMTDETIDVRKQYLEAGMAVKELYSIPDDHIGIELEFVYYLTQKTIELFELQQRDEAARLFEIRGNFLNNHMAQWVPLFVEGILNSTHEDFYKGAAFILRGIITS